MYPVIELYQWMLSSLASYVPPRPVFCDEYAVKKYIEYDGSAKQWSLKVPPLVRMYAVTRATDQGEIVAVVNDLAHKMVVLFTPAAVRQYEARHGQRLTFEVIHRLLVLRLASLRFVSRRQWPVFGEAFAGVRRQWPLLYLEVHEVEMAQRPRRDVTAQDENKLRFLYEEPEYAALFQGPLVADAGSEMVLDEDSLPPDWAE